MWVGGLDMAKTAYYALVESHIRYGLSVWGGTTKQNLDRILILQKKAIRILAHLTPTESWRESFKTLGILTVKGEVEPVSNEETTRMAFIKERDNIMEKMLQETKEKEKPESLLELHQKKLKKKKKVSLVTCE
ncbi:hypothetical protein J6590_050880 [Homalodisca vitripennis]|nr:hypothetical protein J6590_050880 [Homalodisca vitripennis]